MRDESHNLANEDSDPLDALLAQARWPLESEEAHRRLESQIRAAHRSRWVIVAAQMSALAACIALGVLAIHRMIPRAPHPEMVQVHLPLPTAPPVNTPAVATPVPTVVSRPLDASDKLMLIAVQTRAQHKAIKPASQATLPPQPILVQIPPSQPTLSQLRLAMMRRPAEPTVGDLLHRARTGDLLELTHETLLSSWRQTIAAELLGRDDGITAFLAMVRDPASQDAALSALRSSSNPPLNALLAQFDSPSFDTRMSAARAVGSICTDGTTSRLIEMVQQGARRREALAALMIAHDANAADFIKTYRQTAVRGVSHDQELHTIQMQLASSR